MKNLIWSNDIEKAVDIFFDGGRILALIKNTHDEEAYCEIDYDFKHQEWDCASPANNLTPIEVIQWTQIS